MKWSIVTSIIALLFSVHAAVLRRETPMAKVATLLLDMKANIEADGQEEQTSYDKYACWCEDTLGRKANDISTGKDSIEELQTLITKLKGEIGSHGAQIKQLEKDVASNKESQREATSVRTKGNVEYHDEKTESEQCIGALEAAINVLAGAGEKRGFLETMKEAELLGVVAQVRGVLDRPGVARKVGDKDLELVRRFVQHPDDFVGGRSGLLSATQIRNPYGDYAPRSTQIQGILKGMYESFAAGLEKDNAEEAEAQKAYEALMVIKQQELATLETTLQQQQLDIATKTKTEAESNEQLDDTKVQLNADETFFTETKTGCKVKAGEWAERTRLRTEELMAISQAVTILTDPNSVKVFENSTASFVQVAATIHRHIGDVHVGAYTKVAKLAKQFHSISLSKIAVQVKSGGHFDKVIASIDQMIAHLQEEEQDDIEHRDRCERAERKNTLDKDDLNHAINKAGQAITTLEGEETKLQGEIDTLAGDINKTKQDMLDVKDMRIDAVAEFRKAVQDDAQAVALLEQAIRTLTRFYKENNIPLALVATQGKNSTVNPDIPPATTWSGSYNKRTGEARGIIAILEMLREDVDKEMKTARADDAESQVQYEKERSAMQNTLDAQEGSKVSTEKEFVDVQAGIEDKNREKGARENDLTAENDLTSALSLDCSWVASHFQSRRTKRKTEIDGLVEAKNYLAGVESE